MLNGNAEHALLEAESPPFAPGPWKGPAAQEKCEAEAPSSKERPGFERPSPAQPLETDWQPTLPGASGGESGKGPRRRRAIAGAMGSVLFVLAVAGGYVYWSYASRFQS